MRIEYFAEADTLYISLADRSSAESQEIAAAVVADFDAQGRLVGIEIDPVKDLADLSHLETRGLPLNNLMLTDAEHATGRCRAGDVGRRGPGLPRRPRAGCLAERRCRDHPYP